jgi:gas vesicle protein
LESGTHTGNKGESAASVIENRTERIDFMAIALEEDYQRTLDAQKTEVRELVMAGLEQIKEGKTKDFNTVCDRLEKKYRDEAISN